MSTTSTRGRQLVTALLGLATAAALTACGAGLDAQTYQQRPAGNGSNDAVGTLALRNLAIEAPEPGEVHEARSDVRMTITVTNSGQTRDALVGASSSAAEEVVVLSGGQERPLIVEPLASTANTFQLELRGLTRALRSGEYVDLSLRFDTNGTVELLVPVQGPEESDRAVYTGDEEHEPALQYPTGGEHGEDHEGEGAEAGKEAGEAGAEGPSDGNNTPESETTEGTNG